MKTYYTIFRKGWVLNTIAVLMTLFTLQMIVEGIAGITEHGIGYFANGNWIIIPFFFGYLSLDIWILTATFLPIIKISDDGISAYSLFWKRTIKWEEIKSAKLLKTKIRGSRGGSIGSSSNSFEITAIPENMSFFANKGLIVKTFIVISKATYKVPFTLSLGGQLLTHSKITSSKEIAFEHSNESWKIIQKKLNNQLGATF